MINAPFLESSEQLNSFFPASPHKIKFLIFQNISKCSIHGLRPFKHKNMCKLCDIIPDKDKKGRIMAKKCFVLHEGVVYVFHLKKNHHNRKTFISSSSCQDSWFNGMWED